MAYNIPLKSLRVIGSAEQRRIMSIRTNKWVEAQKSKAKKAYTSAEEAAEAASPSAKTASKADDVFDTTMPGPISPDDQFTIDDIMDWTRKQSAKTSTKLRELADDINEGRAPRLISEAVTDSRAKLGGILNAGKEIFSDGDSTLANFLSQGRLHGDEKTQVFDIIDRTSTLKKAEETLIEDVKDVVPVTRYEFMELTEILDSVTDESDLTELVQRIDPEIFERDINRDVRRGDQTSHLDRLRDAVRNHVDTDAATAVKRARAKKNIVDKKVSPRRDLAKARMLMENIQKEMLEFHSDWHGEAAKAKAEAMGISYVGRGGRTFGMTGGTGAWFDPLRYQNVDEAIRDLNNLEADPEAVRRFVNTGGFNTEELEILKSAGLDDFGVGFSGLKTAAALPRTFGKSGVGGMVSFSMGLSSAKIKKILLQVPDELIMLDVETDVEKVMGINEFADLMSQRDPVMRSDAIRKAEDALAVDIRNLAVYDDVTKEFDPDATAKAIGNAFNDPSKGLQQRYAGVTSLAHVEARRESLFEYDEAGNRVRALATEEIDEFRKIRLAELGIDDTQFTLLEKTAREIKGVDDIANVEGFVRELEIIDTRMRQNSRLQIGGFNIQRADIKWLRKHAVIMAARLEARGGDGDIEMAERLYRLTGRIKSINERGDIVFDNIQGAKGTTRSFFGAVEAKGKFFDAQSFARMFMRNSVQVVDEGKATKYGYKVGEFVPGYKLGETTILLEEILEKDNLTKFAASEFEALKKAAQGEGDAKLIKMSKAHVANIVDQVEEVVTQSGLDETFDVPNVRRMAAQYGDDQAGELLEALEAVHGKAVSFAMARKLREGIGYSLDELTALMSMIPEYKRQLEEFGAEGLRHISPLRDAKAALISLNMSIEGLILNKEYIAGDIRSYDAGQSVRRIAGKVFELTREVGDTVHVPMMSVGTGEKGMMGLRGIPEFMTTSKEAAANALEAASEHLDRVGDTKSEIRFLNKLKDTYGMIDDEVKAVANVQGINYSRWAKRSRWVTGAAIAGVIALKVGTEISEQEKFDEAWEYSREERRTMDQERLYRQRLDQASMGNLTLETHNRRNNSHNMSPGRHRHLQ